MRTEAQLPVDAAAQLPVDAAAESFSLASVGAFLQQWPVFSGSQFLFCHTYLGHH
jgi:hypothetical protein